MPHIYFAYASNMDPQTFRRRCPGAKALGPARLPGHRLAFTRYSRQRRGGSADVVADAASEVWGVLYEVDDACLASMDRVEGVPHAYRRETVAVSRADGEPIGATTYVANKAGEFQPNDSYLKVILRGAKAHCLPAEYIRVLEEIRPAL
jgi:gamma-glutamylcyclotransferase